MQARGNDQPEASSSQKPLPVLQVGDTELQLYIQDGELYVNGIRIDNAAKAVRLVHLTAADVCAPRQPPRRRSH